MGMIETMQSTRKMIGNLIHFLIKKFALFRGRLRIDVVQFILNGKLSDFVEGKYSFRQSIANVSARFAANEIREEEKQGGKRSLLMVGVESEE